MGSLLIYDDDGTAILGAVTDGEEGGCTLIVSTETEFIRVILTKKDRGELARFLSESA